MCIIDRYIQLIILDRLIVPADGGEYKDIQLIILGSRHSGDL